MQIELNLDNKEEAKKQVKLIQKSIDDLLEVCNQQSEQLKSNLKVIEDSENIIANLEKGSVDLADSLKAIHAVLMSKSELWKKDKEMNELMNNLSTFILSSTSVKFGTLSQKYNKDK